VEVEAASLRLQRQRRLPLRRLRPAEWAEFRFTAEASRACTGH